MDNTKSMQQLVAEAEVLLSKLRDSANPEIQKLRDRVESSIDEVKESAVDQAGAALDKVRDVTKSVVEYVQENPWIAVAAGTAIAVSLIYVAFSRRED